MQLLGNTFLLLVRVYLGLWFAHHSFTKFLFNPAAWTRIGSAMQNLGLGFAPSFWGFMAMITWLLGGLLLALGLFGRISAAGLAFTMLVATVMHFSVGNGVIGAKMALIYLGLFVFLIITGPGEFVITKFIKS